MRANELAEHVCQGSGINVQAYTDFIRDTAKKCDLKVNSYSLVYRCGEAELLEITSDLTKGGRIAQQYNGFHGNELAAIMASAVNLPCLADYAKRLGIGLKIYPLVNSLGAEKGLRYNPDDDNRGIPNNDFIRYELTNGKLVDDLKNKKKYARWHWAIDKTTDLPAETRLISQFLKEELNVGQTVLLIDNHADLKIGEPETDLDCPATYQYVFGNTRRYRHIVDLAETFVPLWSQKKVSSEMENLKTDKKGFIKDRYDGSIIDLANRYGVEAVTVEVSADTDFDHAALVYGAWVVGLLGLVNRT